MRQIMPKTVRQWQTFAKVFLMYIYIFLQNTL
nr:MAG TPA: hypothetical protein [Caudoviricetes sp.]